MEIIRGKHASFMDASALAEIVDAYESIHIDIGTGDGRYVQHIAQTCPTRFVIGIDACRENLQDVSRRAPTNALFVIANAQALPSELYGIATYITVNFPWGSLVEGLLNNDADMLEGIARIAQPNATLEVRFNGGALAEAGWTLEVGTQEVRYALSDYGFDMRSPKMLTADDLKAFPTTWAKRLAYGRDPRAMFLRGIKKGTRYEAQFDAIGALERV